MMTLKGCVGCRSCEAICSYHLFGKFQPSKSAIVVYDTTDGHGVDISYKDVADRGACDHCVGLPEKLCAKYCGKFRAKGNLTKLLNVD